MIRSSPERTILLLREGASRLTLRVGTILAFLWLFVPSVFAQNLDTAVSALVRISGTRSGTPVRGSGFVVGLDREKATIVTASHVIEGVQKIEVTFAADRAETFPAGAVLGMEAGNPRGLAVFQVRGALPAGIATLSIELESRPRLGDALFLLGFPEMALSPRTTQRILSARSGTLLLIDQKIGEGFSGGPVLKGGKVVGVVSDMDEQTTYAIEAIVVHAALEGWGVWLGGQESPSTMSAVPEIKPTSQISDGFSDRLGFLVICKTGEVGSEKGIDYVRVCPGTFNMGSLEDDPRATDSEKGTHQVTLDTEYWLSKAEITNEQYRHFSPDHLGDPDLPATGVSWNDAVAACKFFGGRLPTEAEWEYAARAGSLSSWSFGNDESKLSEYAWHSGNSSDRPHSVASKNPNDWGFSDMHGNVWEWVSDWFAPYRREPQTNPTGPSAGERRVLRGGAFGNSSWFLRSAFRNWAIPEYRDRSVGFRCVLTY